MQWGGECVGEEIVCPPDEALRSLRCGRGRLPLENTGIQPCDDGSNETRDDRCDGGGACVGTPIDCTLQIPALSSRPMGMIVTLGINPADFPATMVMKIATMMRAMAAGIVSVALLIAHLRPLAEVQCLLMDPV